jgi:hypothetical protein
MLRETAAGEKRGELVCIGVFSASDVQLVDVRPNSAVNGTVERLESG